MIGAISPLPQYAFMASFSVKSTGTTLPFTVAVRSKRGRFLDRELKFRSDSRYSDDLSNESCQKVCECLLF
jgi:hypothetical protein